MRTSYKSVAYIACCGLAILVISICLRRMFLPSFIEPISKIKVEELTIRGDNLELVYRLLDPASTHTQGYYYLDSDSSSTTVTFVLLPGDESKTFRYFADGLRAPPDNLLEAPRVERGDPRRRVVIPLKAQDVYISDTHSRKLIDRSIEEEAEKSLTVP